MIIAIEYIRWLIEERAKINRAQLSEIEFYEKGMKVDISQEVLDHWESTGLNNIDFITSGEYMRRAAEHGMK